MELSTSKVLFRGFFKQNLYLVLIRGFIMILEQTHFFFYKKNQRPSTQTKERFTNMKRILNNLIEVILYVFKKYDSCKQAPSVYMSTTKVWV